MRSAYPKARQLFRQHLLLKSASWALAGTLVARGMAFLAMIIAARWLDKDAFGQLSIVRSTVAVLTAFGGFGLGITASRYIAEFRTAAPHRAAGVLSVSRFIAGIAAVITSGLLFAAAPWMASGVLKHADLAPMLRVGSVTLLFDTLNAAQLGAMQGLECFKSLALINFAVGIATVPLVVVGLSAKAEIGALMAFAVSSFLNWLATRIILNKAIKAHGIPARAETSKLEWKLLSSVSVPATLAAVIIPPLDWAGRALLVSRNPGMSEIASFGAASVIQQSVLSVGAALSMPLLPMIVNRGAAQQGQLQRLNMTWTWIVGVTISLPILVFPEFIQRVLGEHYGGLHAGRTLSISMLCAIVMMYGHGPSRLLVAHGLFWWSFARDMLWGVSFISAAVVLVPLGALGLAWASLISYSVQVACAVFFLIRKRLIEPSFTLSRWMISLWLLLVGLTIFGDTLYSKGYVTRSCTLAGAYALTAILVRRLLR